MRNKITLAITGFAAGAAALLSGVALAQVSSSTAPAGTSGSASLSTSTNAIYPGSPASPSSNTNTGMNSSGTSSGTSAATSGTGTGSVTPTISAGTSNTAGTGSATGNPWGGATGYLMANTPAPEVVTVDQNGTALIRGRVISASGNSLTLQSWGGTWTIRLGAAPSVFGGAGNPGTSLANIPVGDFVGANGVISANQPYTVDATVVRDWTTNPYTGSTSSGASNSSSSTFTPSSSGSSGTGTGASTGSSGTTSAGGAPGGTSGTGASGSTGVGSGTSGAGPTY